MTNEKQQYRILIVLQRHGDDGWEAAKDQPGHAHFYTGGTLDQCRKAFLHLMHLLMQPIMDCGITKEILALVEDTTTKETDND